ncbi:MAG: TetR/AcrR family transcriptional regulator [Desulfobacteraceae bacterium]|jgi:AcrR family transcriptional regulator|nr:TetR/AcrR family transcriptional regulator [Desulfobacteraceae bacterium]
MDLKSFEMQVTVSMTDICSEIFNSRSHSIKIKKEEVAVRNLVRIFKATLKLANRKGFHAMSLRDLCAESGMSMGGLYAYFKNKEELLTLIQEQGRAIVARVMGDRLHGIEDATRALDMAIRSHLYLSEVLQPWFFFSYMETRFFHAEEGKRAIAGELQTEAIFSGILERGMASGRFAIRDPLLVAAAIKALLQDWYLKRWKYKRREISVDAYADFVISMVSAYGTGNTMKGVNDDFS